MGKSQQPGVLTTLARGAGVALSIQITSVGLIYITQILLARWMGVVEFGIYEYAIALGLFLAVFAGLGLPNAVLRFIPEYTVRQDWARLRGMILGSWQQTIIASLIMAGCGTGFLLAWNAYRDVQHLFPLLLGIWTVPLLALMKLQLEMIRANRQIALAYAPSLVVYPFLTILAAYLWLQTRQELTSVAAIALSMLSLFLVLAVQLGFFYRGLGKDVWSVPPEYSVRQWLLVSLPLLFVDSSFIILNQTDTLMLGAMLGGKEVGIYNAALKTAAWVNFILLSVNAVAAPMFASLYAAGDRDGLQRLVSAIARCMFLPALLVAVGLIVFAEPVLGLFGPEFVAARWAMTALIVGQLVNVGAGSVGYLLMMTGHHNQCAHVMGWSALVNLLLNLIGIPLLGIAGAALATAVSMALWNIWLHALVVKHLEISPSIVAALGFVPQTRRRS